MHFEVENYFNSGSAISKGHFFLHILSKATNVATCTYTRPVILYGILTCYKSNTKSTQVQ